MALIEIDLGETIEEFPDGISIIKPTGEEDFVNSDSDVYFVTGVGEGTFGLQPIPEFPDLHTARLYVDVHFDTGGFDATDTGDRGVPPKVAAAGNDTVAAYLFTRDGVDVEWLMDTFDVTRETVHSYLSRVRSRGKEAREELAE